MYSLGEVEVIEEQREVLEKLLNGEEGGIQFQGSKRQNEECQRDLGRLEIELVALGFQGQDFKLGILPDNEYILELSKEAVSGDPYGFISLLNIYNIKLTLPNPNNIYK